MLWRRTLLTSDIGSPVVRTVNVMPADALQMRKVDLGPARGHGDFGRYTIRLSQSQDRPSSAQKPVKSRA